MVAIIAYNESCTVSTNTRYKTKNANLFVYGVTDRHTHMCHTDRVVYLLLTLTLTHRAHRDQRTIQKKKEEKFRIQSSKIHTKYDEINRKPLRVLNIEMLDFVTSINLSLLIFYFVPSISIILIPNSISTTYSDNMNNVK